MSGISRIAMGREEARRPAVDRVPGREVWLKDGDQMFLTSLATGDENDTMLDELYLYTFRLGNRWTNLSGLTSTTSSMPRGRVMIGRPLKGLAVRSCFVKT